MSKAGQIYKNVLNAMQEAEEIEGIENPFEYLKLMSAIKLEVKKRFNNCAERLDKEILT
tara:strand:- start:535 stop:711 length:177 start_codon:yes stop_codon:yes gene_type:complete